jgi:DNA-binding MarR family transcriptional regulator
MASNTNKKPTSTKKPSTDKIDYGLLDQSLGYIIRRAQIRVFQEFADFFEALEVKPAEFSALEIIHRNAGLRQSALAKSLGIQRTNMVGMLDQLQGRNLIERRPSTTDLRAHELHLTSKGKKFLNHLHQQFFKHEGDLENRLGKEAYRETRENLRKIFSTPPSED